MSLPHTAESLQNTYILHFQSCYKWM
jgi:hypothetical protein